MSLKSNLSTKPDRQNKPEFTDLLVGKRLRRQRELRGLSRKKLAKEIDISWQQIQKYEAGTNRISASRLMQFSKLLGVSISYFFEGISWNVIPKDQKHDIISLSEIDDGILNRRETFSLIRAYYKIVNTKTRRQILKLIQALAAPKT